MGGVVSSVIIHDFLLPASHRKNTLALEMDCSSEAFFERIAVSSAWQED